MTDTDQRCFCGAEKIGEGHMVAGGIEHRRGFCREYVVPEWFPPNKRARGRTEAEAIADLLEQEEDEA